jgi:hypothetical protein
MRSLAPPPTAAPRPTDLTKNSSANNGAANNGGTVTNDNTLNAGNGSGNNNKLNVLSGDGNNNVVGSLNDVGSGNRIGSNDANGNTSTLNVSDAGNTLEQVQLNGPVTLQSLSTEVGDAHVGSAFDDVKTGNINNQSGDSATFAGVQTQTNGSGILTSNQTTTAVSASSSIGF